jgi:hypothetical protein
MVTSHGQSDGRPFETNLRDERYLPFEGAGVISTCRLELSSVLSTFDYKNRFPFLFTRKDVKISAVELYAVSKSDSDQ